MNNKSFSKTLPAFVWDNVRLQSRDFLILPLAVCGMWLLVMTMLGLISWVSGDRDFLGIGIAGVIAVVMAVLLSGITATSRIWLEFRIGVQMSVTRARMLAACIALSLGSGLECMASAWLLNRLWLWLAGMAGVQIEDIVGHMPLWGWLLAVLLPAALGCGAGAVLLRYGGKGGWTLYMIVMALCLTTRHWVDWFEAGSPLAQWVIGALPALGFALSAAALAATVLLLRRAAITG